MNQNIASYVPVADLSPMPLTPPLTRHVEPARVSTGIADVLTIGQEKTVFRSVGRALRSTGWAVAHAGSVETAIAYLRSNTAAVAVIEAEPSGYRLRDAVSKLRAVADAPEVVVLTWEDLALQEPELIQAGVFDVVRRPFSQPDLIWAVATAWHHWMSRRERGGPASHA